MSKISLQYRQFEMPCLSNELFCIHMMASYFEHEQLFPWIERDHSKLQLKCRHEYFQEHDDINHYLRTLLNTSDIMYTHLTSTHS